LGQVARLLTALASLTLSVACDQSAQKAARRPASTLAAPILSAQALVARPVRAKTPLSATVSSGSEIVPLEPARVTATPDRPDEAVSEVELEAHFEWLNHPRALKLGGVGATEAQAILRRTLQTVSITLQSDGRLDLRVTSPAFPLPENSRLQARYENFGHFLVWPDAKRYRVLPTGTLRALLRERRVDATPILTAQPVQRVAERRFGAPTDELLFDAALGKLNLRVARIEEAGKGGPLLCRLLLEFLAIAPQSEVCAAGRVPTNARFDFAAGGSLAFAVDSVVRRSELVKHLDVPPLDSQLATSGLPEPAAFYLTEVELAFTSRAQESGAVRAANPSPYAAFLVVDGVPLGFVAPHRRITMKGLSTGTYNIGLRSLFGDEVQPPVATGISSRAPARLATALDAGAHP